MTDSEEESFVRLPEELTLENGSPAMTLHRLQQEIEKYKERCQALEQDRLELGTAKEAAEQKTRGFQREAELLRGKLYRELPLSRELESSYQELCLAKEEKGKLLQQKQELEKELEESRVAWEEQAKVPPALPDRKMLFRGHVAEAEDTNALVVTPRIQWAVPGGSALLTFEEPEVARRVLAMQWHEVKLEESAGCEGRVRVLAEPVELLLPSALEVELTLSDRCILLSNLPRLELSQEQLLDKLELFFSKQKNGGGEVEQLQVLRDSGHVVLTFDDSGVAEQLRKKGRVPVPIGKQTYELKVTPYMSGQITDLQVHPGVCARTVLLSGIPDILDEESMRDALEIHFQKPSRGGAGGMAGRTVHVGGIPTDIPPERVADKLTIHFLRARNGGGEIADITLVAGAPTCALVTFEEPGVAQRVLEVENHVLLVGDKTYPLTVTAYTAQLSPDEIFVRVCMIIDYGRLPDGKTLLRSLRRRYGAVQFSFDPKETLCTVKGPFTELQAFSGEVLRGQHAGEARMEGVSHPAPGTPTSQQGPRSPLPAPRMEKQPSPGQVQEEVSEPPLHRDPVDGEAVEQLEDFSLVMDEDIYLYMQKFCSDKFQRVLHQHQVEVVDVSSNGIAILYLQASSQNPGNVSSVVQARLALLGLYQQLEASLRKEKISRGQLSGDWSPGALLGALQKLCPLLLCHEDEQHLYLIGNLVDVSQAKQYIQDGSAGRRATAGLGLRDPPLATYTAALPGGDARLGRSDPTLEPSPPRLSPGKFEFKGEYKLAPNFSFLQPEAPVPSAWPSPERSSLVTEQAQHSGHWLKDAGALGQSDPAPPSGQHHLPVSVPVTGLAGEGQPRELRDWDPRKAAPLLWRPKPLSLFAGGKESSTLQSLGAWKSPGPMKPQPISSVSSAFKSLSLFDTTGTCSALDAKPPEPGAPLRRSNSFSVPKAKAGETPRGPSRAGGGAHGLSEELSLDPGHWAYLKDIHGSTVAGLCREGGVLLTERSGRGRTVLMLTAEDRTRLLQARRKLEALYQTVCPALVSQSLSYSELAVEGPSDEALTELCSLLKGSSAQVSLSKDRYKLHLTCPRETLLRVSEEFQRFAARRRSALMLSPPALGLEGSLAEEDPSPTQQVKTPDPALAAGYRCVREVLQQLEGSSPGGLADSPERAPQLTDPGGNATKTSRYQPAVGQEDPSYPGDSQDVQGGSSLPDASLAGRQSLSPRDPQEPREGERPVGEPEAARVQRVLPDRFQLARDKSRGGPSEAGGSPRAPARAADGAPQSLPIWLSSSGTAWPAKRAPQPGPGDPGSQEGHVLPAGDGDSPEIAELGGPSPGQEAHEHSLGQCEACQSSHTTTCRAQCGHSLCRTCFAAEDPHPACCGSPRGARAIKGTFKLVTLSYSLPGYFRDPTLKIVYDIPDGVQEAGDPRPGRPYRGGRFQAFLPDNREGKKTAQLLQKAFEQGLTFQIQSCAGEERVTWHRIPHKTSVDKGKARHGYPDSQYLREVCALLRNLGIE